jgi:hypothetical protein
MNSPPRTKRDKVIITDIELQSIPSCSHVYLTQLANADSIIFPHQLSLEDYFSYLNGSLKRESSPSILYKDTESKQTTISLLLRESKITDPSTNRVYHTKQNNIPKPLKENYRYSTLLNTLATYSYQAKRKAMSICIEMKEKQSEFNNEYVLKYSTHGRIASAIEPRRKLSFRARGEWEKKQGIYNDGDISNLCLSNTKVKAESDQLSLLQRVKQYSDRVAIVSSKKSRLQSIPKGSVKQQVLKIPKEKAKLETSLLEMEIIPL